jgi:hypothetical protein
MKGKAGATRLLVEKEQQTHAPQGEFLGNPRNNNGHKSKFTFVTVVISAAPKWRPDLLP